MTDGKDPRSSNTLQPPKRDSLPGSSTADRLEVIRRHLEAGKASSEREFKPTPEEKRKILKARAKTLAQETVHDKDNDSCIEVVEFLLANEKYALELTHIREVYPLKDLTLLPCTPSFVRGIINLRGRILSIIDLKQLFELPDAGLTDLNRVIVLHSDELEFGILADVILGLRSIPKDAIQRSLPTLTGIRTDYLRGVTGDRVAILDGNKILSDSRITVHEEMDSSLRQFRS